MFDWKGFYDVAVMLHEIEKKNVNPEAVYRTAIGRAYYAAFGIARRLAVELGFEEDQTGASEHARLRQWYLSPSGPLFFRKKRADVFFLKRCTDISNDLHRLHGWRKSADYEDELDKSNLDMYANALKVSQKIIQQAQYIVDIPVEEE